MPRIEKDPIFDSDWGAAVYEARWLFLAGINDVDDCARPSAFRRGAKRPDL